VLTNLGEAPVALPDGAEVLLASGRLAGRSVPADTTVWFV
jgi:alpha-glucosidase